MNALEEAKERRDAHNERADLCNARRGGTDLNYLLALPYILIPPEQLRALREAESGSGEMR